MCFVCFEELSEVVGGDGACGSNRAGVVDTAEEIKGMRVGCDVGVGFGSDDVHAGLFKGVNPGVRASPFDSTEC